MFYLGSYEDYTALRIACISLIWRILLRYFVCTVARSCLGRIAVFLLTTMDTSPTNGWRIIIRFSFDPASHPTNVPLNPSSSVQSAWWQSFRSSMPARVFDSRIDAPIIHSVKVSMIDIYKPMKTFTEWVSIREATASDESLLRYVAHIESDPHEDDIATLISMVRQTRDQRRSDAIPLVFARLKKIARRLPAQARSDLMGDIESMEEELYARKPAATTGYDTGSGWKDPSPPRDQNLSKEDELTMKALGKLFDRNDDGNWTNEVIDYMDDNFGVNLHELGDDDDPIINQAYEMIWDQYDTGVLDTRSTAERVYEFLKKNGMV
jgi:hypothetical protein